MKNVAQPRVAEDRMQEGMLCHESEPESVPSGMVENKKPFRYMKTHDEPAEENSF